MNRDLGRSAAITLVALALGIFVHATYGLKGCWIALGVLIVVHFGVTMVSVARTSVATGFSLVWLVIKAIVTTGWRVALFLVGSVYLYALFNGVADTVNPEYHALSKLVGRDGFVNGIQTFGVVRLLTMQLMAVGATGLVWILVRLPKSPWFTFFACTGLLAVVIISMALPSSFYTGLRGKNKAHALKFQAKADDAVENANHQNQFATFTTTRKITAIRYTMPNGEPVRSHQDLEEVKGLDENWQAYTFPSNTEIQILAKYSREDVAGPMTKYQRLDSSWDHLKVGDLNDWIPISLPSEFNNKELIGVVLYVPETQISEDWQRARREQLKEATPTPVVTPRPQSQRQVGSGVPNHTHDNTFRPDASRRTQQTVEVSSVTTTNIVLKTGDKYDVWGAFIGDPIPSSVLEARVGEGQTWATVKPNSAGKGAMIFRGDNPDGEPLYLRVKEGSAVAPLRVTVQVLR